MCMPLKLYTQNNANIRVIYLIFKRVHSSNLHLLYILQIYGKIWCNLIFWDNPHWKPDGIILYILDVRKKMISRFRFYNLRKIAIVVFFKICYKVRKMTISLYYTCILRWPIFWDDPYKEQDCKISWNLFWTYFIDYLKGKEKVLATY